MSHSTLRLHTCGHLEGNVGTVDHKCRGCVSGTVPESSAKWSISTDALPAHMVRAGAVLLTRSEGVDSSSMLLRTERDVADVIALLLEHDTKVIRSMANDLEIVRMTGVRTR